MECPTAEILEFSMTQRGNQTLLFRGYEYTRYRETGSGVISWRCRVCSATKCRALLRTREQYIIGEVPQHCHDSNPQKAQANILKTMMKQDIKEAGATPRNVIGNILSEVSSDILEHLPKQSSLVRNLLKHKDTNISNSATAAFIIPNPATAAFDITEKYADLILHDTGADDPDRILAIGNDYLVVELHKDTIYGDGTFDKAPNMFYQLYTWHAKIGNSYPPCIYFLLQKKNLDTYNRMFTILKQLVPDIMPHNILLDFEKACMSAAQVAFPQAEIKGCYFYLCQSVRRKINSIGLKTVFESDSDMKLKLKSLTALSFIPISDVKTVFNQIAATFPGDDSYSEFLAYFSSTYIEGVSGRPAIFPIGMWNHFGAASESSPKTTNCCEGFHKALNSLFHCNHPSLWNLLDGLRGDIACQLLLLSDANTGSPEVKKKCKRTSV